MDVSVIIVNYNTCQLLFDCLRSIYAQTNGIDFEVIVSDNGSTDDSIEMLKSEFSQVRLIENNANLGFGKANNRALKLAKGKYVLYLNSDTVLLNNAVKMFFDYWENAADKEQIGALGGILLDGKLNPIHSGADLPTYKSMISEQLHSMKWHFIKTFVKTFGFGKVYKRLQRIVRLGESIKTGEIGYVTGADLFLLNNHYAFFDERYFMYFEESDLELQLKKIDKKMFLIDGPRIMHLTGRAVPEFHISSFSELCSQESAIVYAKKNLKVKARLLRLLIFLDRCNPYLWAITKRTKKIYYEYIN